METELELDIKELKSLLEITKRPKVKTLLENEIASITRRLEEIKKSKEQKPITESKPTQSVLHFSNITSYAWDQDSKNVTVYITLKGVNKETKVECDFTTNSFDIKIYNVEGKNYRLYLKLGGSIDPKTSVHRVRNDRVVLILKKTDSKSWYDITDKKLPSYLDETKKDEDPQTALMNMMKKMYEEGDAEMKRTIAKAWEESLRKKPF